MRYSVYELNKKNYQYKRRFLDLFTHLGYGHLTSAYSWAEIATVLYNEILQYAPIGENPLNYDKMVVSKGHGAGMLFPIFEDLGFFTKEEMEDTVRIGGLNEKLRSLYYPGFDFYGGSLGIGIGVACGLAKGAKLQNAKWKVYCVIGDAECYEGSVWEAINFAGHQKLNNLIVVVDRNQLGCSDFTEHMLVMEPFRDRWESFNWDVTEVDGHDVEAVYSALYMAKESAIDKPHCIIAHTKKGKGIDYLIDHPLMHGYMPKGDDIEKAYKNLK